MGCEECHLPGAQKTVSYGFRMIREKVKGKTPLSMRDFGFKWIDLLGTILLPVVLLGVVVHAALRAVVKR